MVKDSIETIIKTQSRTLNIMNHSKYAVTQMIQDNDYNS